VGLPQVLHELMLMSDASLRHGPGSYLIHGVGLPQVLHELMLMSDTSLRQGHGS
jgi:hypothetical protein